MTHDKKFQLAVEFVCVSRPTCTTHTQLQFHRVCNFRWVCFLSLFVIFIIYSYVLAIMKFISCALIKLARSVPLRDTHRKNRQHPDKPHIKWTFLQIQQILLYSIPPTHRGNTIDISILLAFRTLGLMNESYTLDIDRSLRSVLQTKKRHSKSNESHFAAERVGVL